MSDIGLTPQDVFGPYDHAKRLRVKDVLMGPCRWCGRESQAVECSACKATAERNGREEDGRPIHVRGWPSGVVAS